MSNKNLYNVISLSKKAGKVVLGEYKVEKYLKKNMVILAIIAEDSSDNTKKKFINMCKFYNTEYIVYGTKNKLGEYTSRKFTAIVGFTDFNFSKLFKSRYEGEYNGRY